MVNDLTVGCTVVRALRILLQKKLRYLFFFEGQKNYATCMPMILSASTADGWAEAHLKVIDATSGNPSKPKLAWSLRISYGLFF